MHATGIKFTWTDRAADEDGQLLEVRQAAARATGLSHYWIRTSIRSD